jgi:hypothetical protein
MTLAAPGAVPDTLPGTFPAGVLELRTPRAIRERCRDVLDAGLRGELAHFAVDLKRLDETAEFTAKVTRSRYPDLKIPPHGRLAHFDADPLERIRFDRELASREPRERARLLGDVIVTSVLLDAGAGPNWYLERAGMRIGRSEGLAVASLAWMRSGALSSQGRAYEVDAAGLGAVTEASLSDAFQVSGNNPLVGVTGRVHLMQALGAAIEQRSDLFPQARRPGELVDRLAASAEHGELPAERILSSVLDAFGGIWPGRLELHGVALGDVWRHPAALGQGSSAGLVPFHKLSQWLTYSLLPALAAAGLSVRDLDALTGLAEYRNGGLFIDTGVLVPKSPKALEESYPVDSELVVEWRALTVALLDELAPRVRRLLGQVTRGLPLAAVLEGGSWAAGREIAAARRPRGGPPIRVVSDGTVF